MVCILPFTLLAEIQGDLLWNSFTDVNLCPQTCYTHVRRVWRDWNATLTTKTKTEKQYFNYNNAI